MQCLTPFGVPESNLEFLSADVSVFSVSSGSLWLILLCFYSVFTVVLLFFIRNFHQVFTTGNSSLQTKFYWRETVWSQRNQTAFQTDYRVHFHCWWSKSKLTFGLQLKWVFVQIRLKLSVLITWKKFKLETLNLMFL